MCMSLCDLQTCGDKPHQVSTQTEIHEFTASVSLKYTLSISYNSGELSCGMHPALQKIHNHTPKCALDLFNYVNIMHTPHIGDQSILENKTHV